MKSVSILSVYFDPATDMFEVVKEITEDEGSTGLNKHVIHRETFEWHAAIYGHATLEDAMDAVLYEPFVGQVDAFHMTEADARGALMSEVAKHKAKHVKVSSAAGQAKMRAAGVAQKHIDAANSDPLQVIRDNAPFEAETIAVQREFVAKTRTIYLREKAEREDRMKQRVTGAERADALRQRLFRQENMRREGDRRDTA